jgi:hypothetical protein
MMIGQQGVAPGRWQPGGMWVRGLCKACNSFAGERYDLAYADFALGLRKWFEVGQRMAVPGPQAVRLAPGRVSRSVLFGLMAVSPHVRVLHPTLATQLRSGGPVRLSGRMKLQVAVYLGSEAQLTGPMLTGMVDGSGDYINTLAAFTFHPLTWALAAIDESDVLAKRGWTDATEWLRYEDDREDHDLRWLSPEGLTRTQSMLHEVSDDGIQLYSSEIAPIMRGRSVL